ncbi:MAG: hypothetical protein ACI4SC_03085, partial [Candidatus Neoclostridium sp.]
MIYGVAFSAELILSATAGKLVGGGDNSVGWKETSAGGTLNEICDLAESCGEKTGRFEFIGGVTGERIKAALKDKNCKFYAKTGENPLKIRIETDKTTDFTGPLTSEQITSGQVEPLVGALQKLEKNSLLLLPEKLSGITEQGVVKHVFSAVAPLSVRVLFRADEQDLAECLKYNPYYLIVDEKTVSSYCGRKSMTEQELIKAMSYLQKRGAHSVIVFGLHRVLALGYMGGIYKAEGLNLTAKAQTRFMAAFACSCERDFSFERSVKNGCACAFGADMEKAVADENAFKGVFTVLRKRVKKQVIRNVAHYVMENSGVSLNKKPLNLLDLAVLTQITMLNIDKFGDRKLTMCEVKRKYVEKNPYGYVDLGLVVPQSFPLLSLCADSLRYGKVEMLGCKSLLDEEKVVQFKAITFRFPT